MICRCECHRPENADYWDHGDCVAECTEDCFLDGGGVA